MTVKLSDEVNLVREGDIAVIQIDNPPVNALSIGVRKGLWDGIDSATDDDGVKAVVIIGMGRTFPAGADIKEFSKPPMDPFLPEVVSHIEACPKPVVAAVHGTALGGGLEIALGSHLRIADPKARMGLPEVLIGVLPGAGGTQRLPRLAGIETAISMMVSGKPVGAKAALDAGIIDRIAQSDLRAEAIALARDAVAGKAVLRKTRDLQFGSGNADADRAAIAKARDAARAATPHLFAPFRIIDLVEMGLAETDFDKAMKEERQGFFDCLKTPQREGLIHAFFAERRVAKIPEAGRAKPRDVKHLGVMGGGTMGSGIASAALDAGLPVTLVEANQDGLDRARANFDRIYDRHVSRGRLTAEARDSVMARLTLTTDLAALGQADLIIEAVFEEMGVKKEVFARLDKVAKPGAVLASNTSYLDIAEIASATSRPDQVIGLHFFSPANVMKLLEVVVPKGAADDVVATGFALGKTLGKVTVRAGNADGFIGNRILSAYAEIAGFLIEDGASPYEVDAAVTGFGYPMGPCAVGDLAGLDIGWANRKRKAETRDPNRRYVPIADRICQQGWYGQKTGKGWYIYPEGARRGVENAKVLAIIDTVRHEKKITPRSFTPEEIMRRYMAAMVNEGAKVLDEGIALRPSDIDVTLLYGYGFPRWRGGPMKYADMYGLDKLLADLKEFAAEDPVVWKISPLIERLVAEGKTFDSLNAD